MIRYGEDQPAVGFTTATPLLLRGVEMGFWRDPEPGGALHRAAAFIEDPRGRAQATPSGKIELYSERLATIRDVDVHNGDRDVVRPCQTSSPRSKAPKT